MSSAPGNYERKTCAFCEGSGQDVLGTNRAYCGICNGQGDIMVAAPARDCPHCGGTGKPSKSQNAGVYCYVCGGTGWSLRWVEPKRN
jgi:DnaJ-class molecular chaperone